MISVVDIFTAAYLMELSTAAVYKAIHEGRLKGIREGGRYWLPLSEVANRLQKEEDELLTIIGSKKRLAVLGLVPLEAQK